MRSMNSPKKFGTKGTEVPEIVLSKEMKKQDRRLTSRVVNPYIRTQVRIGERFPEPMYVRGVLHVGESSGVLHVVGGKHVCRVSPSRQSSGVLHVVGVKHCLGFFAHMRLRRRP